MKSFFSFLAFMPLLLFADTIAAARKDAGEYWRVVMKDQPMPEALKELVRIEAVSDEKTKCNTPATIELNEEKIVVGDQKSSSFTDDFESRPSLSSYVGDEKSSSFTDDFESRPSLSSYVGNEKSSSFTDEFEPRPNITAHVGDKKSSFTDDFEPRPSATTYIGDEK